MRSTWIAILFLLMWMPCAFALDVKCTGEEGAMACHFSGEPMERSRFEMERESQVLVLHVSNAGLKKNRWIEVTAPGVKRVFWKVSEKDRQNAILRVRYTGSLTDALYEGVQFMPQPDGMKVWFPTVEGAAPAVNAADDLEIEPVAVEPKPDLQPDTPNPPEENPNPAEQIANSPAANPEDAKPTPGAQAGEAAAPTGNTEIAVEGNPSNEEKPADNAEAKPEVPAVTADNAEAKPEVPAVTTPSQPQKAQTTGKTAHRTSKSTVTKKGIAVGLSVVGFLCLLVALWLFHRKTAASPVIAMWKISEKGVISVLQKDNLLSLLYYDEDRQELLVESSDPAVIHQLLDQTQTEQARRAWEQLQKAVSIGEPMQHRLSEKALWIMASWLMQLAEEGNA